MSISLTERTGVELEKAPPITVTEKAALEVKRIVTQVQEEARQQGQPVPEKLYLRMRVVGGGCSGFQHKLDLDKDVNAKLDEVYEINGLDLVVDKRSLMYLSGAEVNYHDDMNRRGFSISNPQAKSTCGCGSSFSM